LFPAPLNLRNPYTNIRFKFNNLYNIYFKLENSGLNTSFLIRENFKLGFNNNKFYTKFSNILKDIAIKNYIFHAEQKELIDDLKDMCAKYFPEYDGELTFNIKLKDEKTIIKKMTKYLQLYYIAEYSRNIAKIKKSKKLLKEELKVFFEINRTLLKNFFDEKAHPLRIIKTTAISEFLENYSYT
jgi:hypothetical protein